MSHLVLSKANEESESFRCKINLCKMTWVVWDSARIWTKGPFSYAILLQLSAKFCSHETPLSLILIETCLYWGFSTNQVVSAAPAPNSKSPCALPPDNQLEDRSLFINSRKYKMTLEYLIVPESKEVPKEWWRQFRMTLKLAGSFFTGQI